MVIASLPVQFALAYETGFKKEFRDGRHLYFYLVWLIPAMLSVLGVVIGLFYKGILSLA